MLEWLAGLDPRALLVGFLVLGAAVAFPLALAAIDRLSRLRLASGTLCLLGGLLAVLVGLAAGLAAASLHTYQRLTAEQPAAKISMRRLGERQFILTVAPAAGAAHQYQMFGDEWQLDARVLKWRGLGTLAGFDTVYRLERLSGRYADLAQERSAARSVHGIAAKEPVDLWVLARRFHDYVPLMDAYYGSGVYMPMADGAAYAVTVSTSGLVVRPENDAARNAVGGWR